jgi:hypothetical protein
MDQVKAAYNFVVAFVQAHPAATVNAIVVALLAKIVATIVL